jgi:hypothetical protein
MCPQPATASGRTVAATTNANPRLTYAKDHRPDGSEVRPLRRLQWAPPRTSRRRQCLGTPSATRAGRTETALLHGAIVEIVGRKISFGLIIISSRPVPRIAPRQSRPIRCASGDSSSRRAAGSPDPRRTSPAGAVTPGRARGAGVRVCAPRRGAERDHPGRQRNTQRQQHAGNDPGRERRARQVIGRRRSVRFGNLIARRRRPRRRTAPPRDRVGSAQNVLGRRAATRYPSLQRAAQMSP